MGSTAVRVLLCGVIAWAAFFAGGIGLPGAFADDAALPGGPPPEVASAGGPARATEETRAASGAAATVPSGGSAAASSSALRRRAPGAQADLLGILRQRLENEEHHTHDLVRERNDRLFQQFNRDVRSPSPLRFGGCCASSGDLFLRAVAPPDLTWARVERRGFDKYAMKQVRRLYRKEYKKDLELRQAADPRMPLDRYYQELFDLDLALDEDRLLWNEPFPAYWEGNPDARGRASPLVLGERIELLRLGQLSFTNDLRLRYDLRSVDFDRSDPDEDATITARRPAHASWLANAVGHGSLLNGEDFALSGKIGLSPDLFGAGPQAAFLRNVSGSLDWTFFDPYDRREIFAMSLDYDFDPRDRSQNVALTFSLGSF
jgi:hypothetical protein